MQQRVGIGVITYNRRDVLAGTIARIRQFTRHQQTDLVVADDGSTDGTLEMLRSAKVPVVTGVNMGIAWNKNRALFLLGHLLDCDVVILLEDDSQPAAAGWEAHWAAAAERWGHVNYAGPWMKHMFESGTGTADDPILSQAVTAQCAAYTRKALTYGGYFDSRFKGYGHEHVEHTRRLIRVGYGGTDKTPAGEPKITFKLISGDIAMVEAGSFGNTDEIARNLAVARELMADEAYRAPWRNDVELRQFRAEMDSAMAAGREAFSLFGLPASTLAPRRSLASRLRGLFGRRG